MSCTAEAESVSRGVRADAGANSHRGGKRLRAKRSWQWLLP